MKLNDYNPFDSVLLNAYQSDSQLVGSQPLTLKLISSDFVDSSGQAGYIPSNSNVFGTPNLQLKYSDANLTPIKTSSIIPSPAPNISTSFLSSNIGGVALGVGILALLMFMKKK